ncbi:MAG: hypothetical protein FWG75_05205 [Cystobacterineae bacterium]|nr:hypothetical protein [Cystobacterineae bacterium]
MNKKVLLALGFFLWQAEAFSEGQSWSTVGGKTLGRGASAIDAGVGWPGLHADLLYGIHKKMHLGVRFAFNWGVEGSVRNIYPGMKLQGLLKATLFDDGFLSFALKFEPGFLAYFYPRSTLTPRRSEWGFTFPLGTQLGFAVMKPVVLGLHLDLPMFLIFGRSGYFQIPLLMGGGMEYFISSKFLINFVVKMGPSFNTNGGSTLFVMEAKFGIAYRFF